MPTRAQQRFTAWSFSRLRDWEVCPLRAKLKHLDRLAEPAGAAMARGSATHKVAADFAAGRYPKRATPVELRLFRAEFAALRKRRDVRVEEQWALTREWRRAEWYGDDAWLRVVVDLCHPDGRRALRVVDHKTGRERDESRAQLSLYAAAAFSLDDDLLVVRTALWYLDLGVDPGEEFRRAQLPRLRAAWEKRSAPMLEDRRFRPRPGDHCRWCHFSRANGGPCKF
jgi:hypothetical protein